MIYGGLHAFLQVKIWKVIIWKVFFPTCLAGFFSLMREILHACRESGRNSVQAGDSLSMRESWKPCHLIQTKTDSKLFISNQMVRPNICILFLILYICPYVQNLSHKQIIKHNVQQADMNQNEILHLLNEV